MTGQMEIFLPSERYGHETGVLADFMNELVVNSEVRVSTAYNYYMVVRTLAKYLYKTRNNLEAPVDEIELPHITIEFMAELTEEEWDGYLEFYWEHMGEKSNSHSFRVTVFCRFYSWLAAKNGGAPPLFVMETRRPDHSARQVAPVTKSMMHEIVLHMTGEMRFRDICIVTLAYECGLGLDELTALQMEDLELDRIRVRSEQGRVRYIPLSSTAKKSLRLYLPTRIPPLYGGNPLFVSKARGSLKRTAVYNVLARAVDRSSNLPRRVGFRDLQQTWALRMAQQNEDMLPECSRINSRWYIEKKIKVGKSAPFFPASGRI